MLARLSTLAAPFTADGAEALGGQDVGDPVEALSTLLDHSMVSRAERPDGQRAFRLLDPIRRFAAAQLEDADETLIDLERYLLGVLGGARRRHGSQDRDMRHLDSEQPNLRVVLSWVARDGRSPDELLRAIGDVWVWLMVRGHLRQSDPMWRQIAPLLAQEPHSDSGRMARAWLLAVGWTNQGEFIKAVDLLDEVMPAARAIEQPSRIALLLMVRGVARVYSAHEQARADFAEALSVARAADAPLAIGYVQAHYGALLCLDGDLGQARAMHEEALTIARSIGDENLRGEAHHTLAIDAITAGDAEAAAAELTAAVRHYRNLDHFEGLTRCLGALSGLAIERGDPRLAARLMGTAAAVRERFELRAWPWVIQAEARTSKLVAAALTSDEYAAQRAVGRSQTIDEAITAALPTGADQQPADA
jgi:tetratricopeptide (TPR) repeat protein